MLNNPKYSDARTQVKIRAFDDDGSLLPDSATLDAMARTSPTQPIAFEFKLGTEISNPLRPNTQAVHYPSLVRNGGVVVSKNAGPAFRYLEVLPPTPVHVVRPPMYTPAGGYVTGSLVANTPGHH